MGDDQVHGWTPTVGDGDYVTFAFRSQVKKLEMIADSSLIDAINVLGVIDIQISGRANPASEAYLV